MSRASYARARRAQEKKKDLPEEKSALKATGEKVAKKVYETAKPVVEKVKGVAVKGIEGYLKGTNKLADQVKKVIPDELEKPRYSNRSRRMRAQ